MKRVEQPTEHGQEEPCGAICTCHSESATADEESPSGPQSDAKEQILRFVQDDTDYPLTPALSQRGKGNPEGKANSAAVVPL